MRTVKKTSVALGEETIKLLDEYANKYKLSRSRVIEMFLLEKLEKIEAAK